MKDQLPRPTLKPITAASMRQRQTDAKREQAVREAEARAIEKINSWREEPNPEPNCSFRVQSSTFPTEPSAHFFDILCYEKQYMFGGTN